MNTLMTIVLVILSLWLIAIFPWLLIVLGIIGIIAYLQD
jgi:hypothetical protein